MCAPEVGMSLVKAMTNGEARVCTGQDGRHRSLLHGVQIWQGCPLTPLILAYDALVPLLRETRSQVPLSSTCVSVRACVLGACVRVCEWITRLPARWATGVKIRCEVYVWWITNMWDNRSPTSSLLFSLFFFLMGENTFHLQPQWAWGS